MGVVQEAYSRRGIYEGDSGSEDEAEALFREVAALEERVQNLGAESETRELLSAVAELRVVRGRYNDSLERRRSRGRRGGGRPASSGGQARGSRSPPRRKAAWADDDAAARGGFARRSYERPPAASRGHALRRSAGDVADLRDPSTFGSGYVPASPRTLAARRDASGGARHTTPAPFGNLGAWP